MTDKAIDSISDIYIDKKILGKVWISNNDGLWSATCLYWDINKRLLKAGHANTEEKNPLQVKMVSDTQKDVVEAEIIAWASTEFDGDVSLEENKR